MKINLTYPINEEIEVLNQNSIKNVGKKKTANICKYQKHTEMKEKR